MAIFKCFKYHITRKKRFDTFLFKHLTHLKFEIFVVLVPSVVLYYKKKQNFYVFIISGDLILMGKFSGKQPAVYTRKSRQKCVYDSPRTFIVFVLFFRVALGKILSSAVIEYVIYRARRSNNIIGNVSRLPASDIASQVASCSVVRL